MITTWKLPSSKVYHGLNNALGIRVHEKHYQVLSTQMVPICENLGLGPWTIGTLLPILIRPSVCDAFFTMFLSSFHHEFLRSYYDWQKWCPCKRSRSKVKVTEVKTHLSLFLDCNCSLNSHMMMKWCKKLDVAKERCPIVFQGHPPNFKFTRDKKSPILTRIERFRSVTPVSIHRWFWNDAQIFI